MILACATLVYAQSAMPPAIYVKANDIGTDVAELHGSTVGQIQSEAWESRESVSGHSIGPDSNVSLGS